jgi:hypothetical protein
MLMLLPSIGVGSVGSLITAIALAADWYIWKFRYRISSGPVATRPGNNDISHVPSVSGREFFVSCAPEQVGTDIPSVHQTERELFDIGEQG